VFLLALACGGGESVGTPGSGTGTESDDATGTTGADATSEGTATTDSATGSGTGTGTEPPPDPPPVAPFFEPEPLPAGPWMVADVDGSNDGVHAAIDDKSFALPPAGEAYGAFWTEVDTIPAGTNDYLYAATEVDVPADRNVFARLDTVRGIFADNANEQPGDVYAFGRYRAPLDVEPGVNLIVAQVYGRRGEPVLAMFSTPDEVFLNLEDMTTPQYPVGDGSTQWVGVPVLNLTDVDTRHLRTHVLENEFFAETIVEYPGIPAATVSQLAFELVPKAPFAAADLELPVTLRVEPLWFEHSYEREITIQTVDPGAAYRRTRRSEVDGSVQFYGVRAPTVVEPGQTYGLMLSLHGAGVNAQNQAASYSAKDWAYVIAPTNRREYGFDWEEWGRLDALEALEHARTVFPIDDTRVHLTGHSMGGHGTWHVGIHFPSRFGVISPSAGWISFNTYGSQLIPDGVLGAARSASITMDFIENFSNSSVYIIHGLNDTTVGPYQAQTMYDALLPIAPELWYHAEPDVGHWWDLDPDEPGTDCVDWEPMFEVAAERYANSTPLEFRFTSAGPWVSPDHSYVRLIAEETPMENSLFESATNGTSVTLTTTNVRRLQVDTDVLLAAQMTSLTVDGMDVPVDGSVVTIGPAEGKTPEQHGPLNQVFFAPVLYVYPDDGPNAYREYAALLTSLWTIRGNGQAQAIALSGLTGALQDEYNIVYLGVPPDDIVDLPASIQFDVTADAVTFGGQDFLEAAVAFVFPADTGRLSALFTTVPGFEYLLGRYRPFTSRAGKPDYYIWRSNGVQIGGFFDHEWTVDPELAEIL
jgi:S-formylglutathione hydrolase FrmB